MDARQVNRHANLAKNPCNTRVILFSPRPLPRAWRPSPQRGYTTSRPCFTAHWYHTRPEAVDIPYYCGAGGRIRPALCGTSLKPVLSDTLNTPFSPLVSHISSNRATMRIFITSIEARFNSFPITYLKLRRNHSPSKDMARTNVCVESTMRVPWQYQ